MEEKDTIVQELESIRKSNNGILPPRAVIEAAADEKSPLHSRFTWDDTEAAEQYRLWQARQLIRLVVTVMPVEKKEYTVRQYISLSQDRVADGGYRLIADVLNASELRKQMLIDAMKEMRTFKVKYARLNELAGVFAEMDKLEKVIV